MTNGNKEREKVSVVLEEEKTLETKSWIRSGASEWERREHNDWKKCYQPLLPVGGVHANTQL